MSGDHNLDYPSLAKLGFLFGASMFVLGGVGHLVGPALVGELSGLESTLLVDLEIGGILIGLFAPLTFGIVLPLTE